MKILTNILLLLASLLTITVASAQAPEWNYDPVVTNPENTPIPIVLFDEGHNNFHKSNVLYYGFTKLLTADGYNVRTIRGKFVDEPNQVILPDFQQQKDLANILVIANACPIPSIGLCEADSGNAFSRIKGSDPLIYATNTTN
jgi:hypothetical protein